MGQCIARHTYTFISTSTQQFINIKKTDCWIKKQIPVKLKGKHITEGNKNEGFFMVILVLQCNVCYVINRGNSLLVCTSSLRTQYVRSVMVLLYTGSLYAWQLY